MESRSFRIFTILFGLICLSADAKNSTQLNRDAALESVIKSDKESFNKRVKKAMRLNSKFIEKLKRRNDSHLSLLLAKAEGYSDQIGSKDASKDDIVENLKQQNAVLNIIDQKIRLETSAPPTKADSSLSSLTGKQLDGQIEHSPGKKVKSVEQDIEPTIFIPLDRARRAGFDKLIEDE